MTALRAVAGATLLCVAASGCGASSPPESQQEMVERLSGTIERVVDGDTIVARVSGRRLRVRLLGVDAPETAAGYGSAECFGPEAAGAAEALLPRGARVGLRTDPSQGREDRFGRLLAEVTPAGAGRTVNEQLVAGGYAEVFRGDGRGRLQPALREAERRARDRGLGLWSACPRPD